MKLEPEPQAPKKPAPKPAPKPAKPKYTPPKPINVVSPGGGQKDKGRVTITVKPGDTNASIAERLGVSRDIANKYIPVVPKVGTQVTIPLVAPPTPTPPGVGGKPPDERGEGRVQVGTPPAALGGRAPRGGMPAATPIVPSIFSPPKPPAPPAGFTFGGGGGGGPQHGGYAPGPKGRQGAAARPYEYSRPPTSVLTPGEAGAGTQWSRYGVSTVVNRGPNVTTKEALGQTSRDVLSYLENFGRPEWIGDDVKYQLGLTTAQMQAMGYVQAPDTRWYRVDFAEETPAVGGGAIGGGGWTYGYGGGGGGGGGYGAMADLISWRIGL